jgi:di/tricarboxylate transporter
MIEFHLSADTFKAAMTLVILLAAIYSFIREKLPPDVTALLAILALLLTGILKPEDAFSGFSHPATISVAAVLVLSAAIERTGALTFIARRLLAPIGKSEWKLTLTIMLVIGGISAFINNTAAVAIFIPVVMEVCRRTGASPGRVLMPMSHAATIGGMCTLIGTSTNLVAHEFALREGLPGFSMFELGKVGLPMVVVGFAYMILVGRVFLPRNIQSEVDPFLSSKRYLAEIIVEHDSPWIGREISAESIHREFEVDLFGVTRRNSPIALGEPGSIFTPGDSLRVVGPLDKVLSLAAQTGMELHWPESKKPFDGLSVWPAQPPRSLDARNSKAVKEEKPVQPMLAEVVVLGTSGLIGQTLKTARFAEKYDAVVLALRRPGLRNQRPSTTRLRAGDVLVVEGEKESLQSLADTLGFVVISTLERPERRPTRLVITILTLIAVIAIVSFRLLPIVTAATAGCAVLMLTGCLRPREAYKAIDLSLVFLLAGSLALGIALDKTGITKLLAKALAGMTGVTGPYLVLISFFVVSVLISEMMSNSGTVALLGPLAISAAQQIGVNPTSLLVAVTFGASAAFAMPIGYQTSLMIYGPGGYRIRDFVKMGIVLDILLAALALILIPRFWPLTPQ